MSKLTVPMPGVNETILPTMEARKHGGTQGNIFVNSCSDSRSLWSLACGIDMELSTRFHSRPNHCNT